MNYADQAARLWVEHLVLKDKIKDRTRINRDLAEDRVFAKIEANRDLERSRERLTLRELKAINEADIIRASMIDEDKFIREQTDSLNLLALVHGHKPTGGTSQ